MKDEIDKYLEEQEKKEEDFIEYVKKDLENDEENDIVDGAIEILKKFKTDFDPNIDIPRIKKRKTYDFYELDLEDLNWEPDPKTSESILADIKQISQYKTDFIPETDIPRIVRDALFTEKTQEELRITQKEPDLKVPLSSKEKNKKSIREKRKYAQILKEFLEKYPNMAFDIKDGINKAILHLESQAGEIEYKTGLGLDMQLDELQKDIAKVEKKIAESDKQERRRIADMTEAERDQAIDREIDMVNKEYDHKLGKIIKKYYGD